MSVSFIKKVNEAQIANSDNNLEKTNRENQFFIHTKRNFQFKEVFEKANNEKENSKKLNQNTKKLPIQLNNRFRILKKAYNSTKFPLHMKIFISAFSIFLKIGHFFSNIGKAISHNFTILTPNFFKLAMFASKCASLIKRIMEEKEQKIEINIYNDNRLYLSLQKSEQDKHGRRRSLSLPPETIRRIASQH